MHWQVDIAGDPETLKALSSACEKGYRYIEVENGKCILNPQLFEECTLPDQVRAKARDVLFMLNRFAGNFLGLKGNANYVDVRSIDPDGSRTLHVKVIEAISTTAALVRVEIRNADGTVHRSTPVTPDLPNLHRWVELLESDNSVRKVERLLAEQASDWVNLSRVLEVIQGDVGGQNELIRQGYTDKRSRSRFGQTSNHTESAGDLARHGYNKEKPPTEPMTLPDARAYVHKIRRRWLQQKLDNLDGDGSR